MKGSLYANPTFISKKIRQPTVISTQPLVAYDENRLYYNNLSIKWQAKDIVNCTFSPTYKVLLILSDDCKIYVLNEQLEVITQLSSWESKYIVGFRLIQQLNQILLIGTTQVQVMKIKILTNIKKTKFLSSMKFNIKKQMHLGVQPHNKLKWNKGYGYIVQQDLLYVWSLQDVFFYSLQKLTIRNKAAGITKKQSPITTAYFSNFYKYTIGGLTNGQVKVWRISINPLSIQKQILIHSFAHHCKQVEQIIQGQNEKTIITLGLDLYVCFLSIQTFQILRIFNFVGEYTKIYLFDHVIAYAIKDFFLGELNYGKNLEFVCQLTGVPISYGYNSKRNQEENTKVQLTLNTNIGIQLNLNQLNSANDLNKLELVHIYPPLKSKNISQILSCPFKQDNYYLLVEDGDIFHVIIENGKGKIDKHHVISKICDSQYHQFHQTCSFIAFLRILPPKIDTEMIDKVIDLKYEQSETKYEQTKLITIGCNKGSIIFVSIDKMEQIYARITYHREKIVNIQQIYSKQNNQYYLISICQQNYLKIINFKGGRASCVHSVCFGDTSIKLYGFQQYLALIFQKGIFQIAKFSEENHQPVIIVNRDCINHQDEIVSMNYRSDFKLLLTGGKDNRIKIWTTYKILMYEIILDQLLKFCMWGTRMNIVLIQNMKLCCLRNIPLKISLNDVQIYNKQFENAYMFDDQFTLTKFLESYLYGLKQKRFKIRSVKSVKYENQQKSPKFNNKSQLIETIGDTPKQKKSLSLTKSRVFTQRTPIKSQRQTFRTESSQKKEQKIRQQSDLQAIKKHLEQMSSIKKQSNKYNLPKITTKNQDVFVEFMRQRLLNKRLITRRDITLNRIILKNLIKDHIRPQNQFIKSVRIE